MVLTLETVLSSEPHPSVNQSIKGSERNLAVFLFDLNKSLNCSFFMLILRKEAIPMWNLEWLYLKQHDN